MMSGPQDINQGDQEDAIDRALADYLRLVDSGNAPDLEQFLADHPTIADELRDLLSTSSTIESMASGTATNTATNTATASATPESDDPDLCETVALDRSSQTVSSQSREPLIESFGEFELLEELGRGGMGIVYKARQTSMNRLVALKMIISGGYSSEDSVRRFYLEAEAAGKLSHENIVRAYAAGEHAQRHFFAMELIEGRTLRDILKNHNDELTAKTIATYLRDLALAVQYAHDQGILHRDLKPSNILVDEQNVPKVADFGLAKHMDAEDDRSFESATGSVLGTPSYMSPEQAASRKEQIGPASDIYSLGAILYELLTGRPPFKDETPVGTLLLVMHQEVKPPSSVNKGCDKHLEAICLKCLQKKPKSRYSSCSELAADLDRYLRDDPVSVRRLTTVQRAWFWLRGVPLVSYLLGRDFRHSSKGQHRAQWGAAFVLALVLFLFIARTSLTEYAYLRSVEVGVGEKTGEYERIGQLLAQSFPHDQARIINTRGSLDSRNRLLHHEVDIALLQDNTVSFEDVAIVAPLYREAILVVVRNTAEIATIHDLKGKAIALGRPTSGSRATSDQLLLNLNIETKLEHQDSTWTDLLTDHSLDGAIITVSPRDSRLETLLNTGEFRIVPLEIDDLPDRFRPYHFLADELPLGAAIGPEGLSAATAEAVLVVRKTTPSWFVRDCLEKMYGSQDEQLQQVVLDLDHAAWWSEGRSLHPAAKAFFKSHLRQSR